MSEQDKPLPLTFPLHGARLIEASAGTGKTFTLAALYVRLVLEHGGENAFRKRLLPPDILVVTFTEAATRELRDRIRDRLAETARFFRGQEDHNKADPFVEGLLQDYEPEQYPGCADLLEAAAQWMDEAAVYTIHGFCSRMLRQHAFDSGSLFNLELSQDEDLILEQAVQDYWRIFCYPLNEEEAEEFSDIATTPAGLQGKVRGLLGKTDELDANKAQTAAEVLDTFTREKQKRLKTIKSFWKKETSDLAQRFEAAWKDERLSEKKPSTRKKILEWLNKIIAWSEDPDATNKPVPDTPFKNLKPDNIAEHGENIDDILEHPAIQRLDELKNPASQLPRMAATLLPHAATWISHRIQQQKRARGVIGFDDMLTRLRDALRGDNGEKLAQIIREQFPVAMIDEFQDTDPVQYEIFHRIYHAASNRTDEEGRVETGWFMIGDPKQAIYAFRGADIFTYLKASGAVGDKVHTLDRNFRSSRALVESVNKVFGAGEQRKGGAFLLDNRIPFRAVDAKGRGEEQFRVEGEDHPALTFWLLESDNDNDSSMTVGDYRPAMADACAAEMTRLLNLGRKGKARFHDKEDGVLKPADMAVLVRTGSEAALIRDALDAHGVRSVYLSAKDNVLNSPEAGDALLWLTACAEPESESALRTALATATLDYSWAKLDELGRDERLWEDKVEQFRGYRQRWRRQGVLPMLRQLLRDRKVPGRLMQLPGGERSLTNLLHLSELLQQASAHLDGEQALVRWLAEEQQAAAEGQTSDEQIMRLESDADLVKVITIHKSKGLEYPLVFLPFICHFRPKRISDIPLHYHGNDDEPRISLNPDPSLLAQAERERLAEDLRLLYVAMTRPKHACWLGLAPLRSGRGKDRMDLHQTAIGHLLGMEAGHKAGDLKKALEKLANTHEATVLTPAPEPSTEQLLPGGDKPELRRVARFEGVPMERWWIASYSALRHDSARMAPPDSSRDEDYLEEETETIPPSRKPAEQRTPHDFIRGPMAGTFLHGLLELMALEGFDADFGTGSEFRDQLKKRLTVRRWEDWQPLLEHWLEQLVSTPLPLDGNDVTFSELAPAQYRPELEFMLQATAVPADELDRIIREHVLPGEARPPLGDEQLNGMLKGFIDLVFEHQGRYFVMDYKSNHLGNSDAAYTEDAMRAAVLHARYDVQYSLYLFALHRLLKSRLGDAYDYDTHVGGAAYHFLRGINAESRGIHFERPPAVLMEELDALFKGETANA